MGILGWLFGYLVLSVKGAFPERFVNLCTLKGIYLKDVIKKDEGLLIKSSVKAFRKMIVPAYRASCRVKIVKKEGLPFLVNRLKKRKALVCGALLFAFITAFLNSFIWSLRIDGNEILTDEEIKILATYCGLHQGVVKYKVDEKKFSENALKCEPRLSWIWPEIKGTVCYIHVREKALSDPPVDTKKPCNVIASRSGIINSITVKRGWPCVMAGDSVTEGQVLISSEKEGFSPVHAMGEVNASYWTEVCGRAKCEKEIVTYTGREKSYYSIVIGSFGMSFRFSGKAPYESFSKKKEEKNLRLFEEIELPIKLVKVKYSETVKEKIKISPEKAVEEEKERIINEFREGLSQKTEIKNITTEIDMISETEGFVRVIFECTTDIALKDKG